MDKEELQRTSVRLRIEKGLVLLRYGGVPSVACSLIDLSEGGCRCLAPILGLDPETATAWKKILGLGRPLSIEISSPPNMVHFPFDVELRGVQPMENGIELGLMFRNLDPEQQRVLGQTMLSLATDKVRDAFSPSKQSETSAYLVGAGKAEPGPQPVPVSGMGAPAPGTHPTGRLPAAHPDAAHPTTSTGSMPPPLPAVPPVAQASSDALLDEFLAPTPLDPQPAPPPPGASAPAASGNQGPAGVLGGAPLPISPGPTPLPMNSPFARSASAGGLPPVTIPPPAKSPSAVVPAIAPQGPIPPPVKSPSATVSAVTPPLPPPVSTRASAVVPAASAPAAPTAPPSGIMPAPPALPMRAATGIVPAIPPAPPPPVPEHPPVAMTKRPTSVIVPSVSARRTTTGVVPAAHAQNPDPAPRAPSVIVPAVSQRPVSAIVPAVPPSALTGIVPAAIPFTIAPAAAPAEPAAPPATASAATLAAAESYPPPPPGATPAEPTTPGRPEVMLTPDAKVMVLHQAKSGGELYQLEALSPEDALKLLRKRSGSPEVPDEPPPIIEVEEEAPSVPASAAEEASEAQAAQAPGDPFRGKMLGEVLVRMGKLTEAAIEDAIKKSKLSGERLGKYLLREGLITPTELCRALALKSGLPMTDLAEAELAPQLEQVVPYALMTKYEFIPFDDSGELLCIAAANPIPASALAQMESISARKIEVFLAQDDLVHKNLLRLRPAQAKTMRQHVRYRTDLPFQYRLCNRLGSLLDEALFQGRLVDISEGGFLAEGPAPDPIKPDEILRRGICMRVELTHGQNSFRALCGVRYVKPKENVAPGELPWVFGLQVVEMGDADRRQLKEICMHIGIFKGR